MMGHQLIWREKPTISNRLSNTNNLIRVETIQFILGCRYKCYVKMVLMSMFFSVASFILFRLCCNRHFMFITFDQFHFRGATIPNPRGESTNGLLAHSRLRFAAPRCHICLEPGRRVGKHHRLNMEIYRAMEGISVQGKQG